MAKPTDKELIEMLSTHEWSWKEGWKVVCNSCGAQYKDTVKNRKHRAGCPYGHLLKLAREGMFMFDDFAVWVK